MADTFWHPKQYQLDNYWAGGEGVGEVKKILESPKIIVYENVKKINDIIDSYAGTEDVANFDDMAKEILDAFNIPYGKQTVVELFENNVQAKLITNKKGIAKIVVGLAKWNNQN